MKINSKRFIAAFGALAMVFSMAACSVDTHTHDYSEIGSNKTHHWKYCAEDNEKDQDSLEKHMDENADGKCDVCGYDVGLPHVHDYTAWGSDADNHWKYCPEDGTKDETTVDYHVDEDEDGICDVCGRDLSMPTVTEVTVESAEMTVIDSKPYLVVKGVMPTDIGCIKLHADGNNVHYYGDNVSTEMGKFELRFDLSQVPTEGTPWLWFHLYTYTAAEPADLSAGQSIDTKVEGLLEVGAYMDCNGVRYTVQGNDYGMIVIQPTDAPQTTVTNIAVETEDGKPVLVVKGTMPTDIACIKLHADADGAHYYGDNVATESGKFEFRFDLTQLRKDGKWAWFHIWTYDDADPEDLTAKATSEDLLRGNFLTDGVSVVYEGVCYETANSENYGLVVFYAYEKSTDDEGPDDTTDPTEPTEPTVPTVPTDPTDPTEPTEPDEPTEVSELTVQNITVEEIDGKLYLVVKGTMSTNIPCIALHGRANGRDYYGRNVANEEGKFEIRFDLTQVTYGDTPWVWFHIYVYADAEPADLGSYADMINLQRENFFNVNDYVDFDNVRYTVQNNDQLVIQPTKVPSATVTAITVEEIDGKLYVVVKGTMPTNVPCIALHGDANGRHHYGENVATEAGKFELRFDLTQVDITDTPWIWFHIYVYSETEPADLSNYAEKIDLKRGNFLEVGESVEFDGVSYTVQNKDQLVVQPKAAG